MCWRFPNNSFRIIKQSRYSARTMNTGKKRCVYIYMYIYIKAERQVIEVQSQLSKEANTSGSRRIKR